MQLVSAEKMHSGEVAMYVLIQIMERCMRVESSSSQASKESFSFKRLASLQCESTAAF